MKQLAFFVLFSAGIFFPFFSVSARIDAYPPQWSAARERAKELLAQMTLEEKAAQMDMAVIWDEKKIISAGLCNDPGFGAWFGEVTPEKHNELQRLSENTRLKIPYLIGVDAAHGNALMPRRTVFPTSISMAATFDPGLVRRAAVHSAAETRASGNHWTFAPCIDIVHDARFGRTGETYGEDPFLASRLVEQAVKGLQGDLGPANIAACVKHLLGGGAAVGGVNHGNTEISERMMRRDFLPPFKAAIEAGVLTLMPGHNNNNSIPAHADEYLLTGIIKKEYGFEGFFISDMGDIENLRFQNFHKVAHDMKDAVRQAIGAGVDMKMYSSSPDAFKTPLVALVREGTLPESRLDDAVTRILTLKFALGLFEHRYIDPLPSEAALHATPQSKAVALEAARKSIVLLKNKDNILPIDASACRRILVTGPNAANQAILGDWSTPQPADHVVTILDGIRKIAPAFGAPEIIFSDSGRIKGRKTNVTINTTDPETQNRILAEGGEISDATIADAVEKARACDLAVVVIGGYGLRSDWGLRTYGESADRPTIDFYGRQVELVQKIAQTGIPTVIVLVNGTPLNNPWITENAPAILEAFEPGMFGGQAVAEILFGAVNPSGRLPITIPQTAGHLPQYYYQTHARYLTGYGLGSGRADDKPAFAFGHGLSYTAYDYTGFTLARPVIAGGEPVVVRGSVTNTGNRAGTETVMVFIRDLVSSVVTPVATLKGFTQVTLEPGETKEVEITIPFNELALWDRAMRHVVEPGDFEIRVGHAFDDIRFKAPLAYRGE